MSLQYLFNPPKMLFVIAAIWYLILTSIMGVVQRRLENHYGRHELPAETRFKQQHKARTLLSGQR